MTFASRQDAGKRLGQLLAKQQVTGDIVVGLPRGGVVVAAEVARLLKLPLAVLAVRKIGHPYCREFALGALAEGDIIVLDEAMAARNPFPRAELDEVIAEETGRLRDFQNKFHQTQPRDFSGHRVILVDDGLATGATMAAAVKSAQAQKASRVIVAVPVASTHAIERLARTADDVVALLADPDFNAVGQYYAEFFQTTDEEVLALLRAPAKN
jgi:putative phosphoribosyl transferase